MPLLDALDKLNEVQKAVETDLNGKPVDFKGEIDAEPVGALIAYVQAHIDQAGVQLGLGNVLSLQVSGPDVNIMVYSVGESLIGVFLGPQQSATQLGGKVRSALGLAK